MAIRFLPISFFHWFFYRYRMVNSVYLKWILGIELYLKTMATGMASLPAMPNIFKKRDDPRCDRNTGQLSCVEHP